MLIQFHYHRLMQNLFSFDGLVVTAVFRLETQCRGSACFGNFVSVMTWCSVWYGQPSILVRTLQGQIYFKVRRETLLKTQCFHFVSWHSHYKTFACFSSQCASDSCLITRFPMISSHIRPEVLNLVLFSEPH